MPDYQGEKQTLGEILLSASEITDEFVLDANLLRDEDGYIKRVGRKKKEKLQAVTFTIMLRVQSRFQTISVKPSRTIITGEESRGASKFKHVVAFEPEKL